MVCIQNYSSGSQLQNRNTKQQHKTATQKPSPYWFTTVGFLLVCCTRQKRRTSVKPVVTSKGFMLYFYYELSILERILFNKILFLTGLT